MRKLLWIALIVPLWGQQPPADAPKPRRPPPQPKNLQVLKVAPEQLIPIMRSFAAGLGVECGHCHVQGDFASDDKKPKLVARQMITMSQAINSNFPEKAMRVTCYTCHRGELDPKTAAPSAARPEGPKPAPPQ